MLLNRKSINATIQIDKGSYKHAEFNVRLYGEREDCVEYGEKGMRKAKRLLLFFFLF